MYDHVFGATFALLPRVMDSPQARALLLAIGLQESKFVHRTQIGGPARGFWQFERSGGVVGVLAHPASTAYAARVCADLRYRAEPDGVYLAMAHNDTLACAFARLLLWTDPKALSGSDNHEGGWAIYMRTWRPGKPHPSTWQDHYRHAWDVVLGAAE
jgi:hypothetical protein